MADVDDTCRDSVPVNPVSLVSRVDRVLVARERSARAALPNLSPPNRCTLCRDLAWRFLLTGRLASAKLWHQQSVTAWLDGGCVDPPDLQLAYALGSSASPTAALHLFVIPIRRALSQREWCEAGQLADRLSAFQDLLPAAGRIAKTARLLVDWQSSPAECCSQN